MRLDKYQKCRNIISQTSLLSSYTGSILMQYTSYIGSFSMDGIYLYIFYIGRVIRCTCAYVINSCYITIEYFINFGTCKEDQTSSMRIKHFYTRVIWKVLSTAS